MNPTRVIFFGSFQTYSVQVLRALTKSCRVVAVVTTPAKPQGRHLTIIPTPVDVYARQHNIPVFALDQLGSVPKTLPPTDFFVVAGYGKRIPDSWLKFPSIMAINMHPSLLPNYRGAFPAEWAILRGDKRTGITLLTVSPTMDAGDILAQKSLPIAPDDTRLTLYKKLYDLGGNLLIEYLPKIAYRQVTPIPQPAGTYFYARRLTREDGFVDWQEFEEALTHNPESLDRKFRALTGWPGVWTTTPTKKRLILVSLKPATIVHLEGKKPVPFTQFRSAYLPS